ncbi:hypothetical protein AB1N83_013594 [Pleurotus pulmonarius]
MSSTPPSKQALNQRLQGDPSTITQKAQTDVRATCTHNREGRIIVISADGTANKFGEKNTNVVEFNSRISRDENQITFYISGIGTHTTSTIGRIFDMAFANSFEVNLLIAYKWLADTYKPGDRIFLFGFSRGAYQVRVIAGMIARVGLIYSGNTTQLPDVFKLYMSTTERQKTKKYTEAMELCETFKSAFSWPNVKVHFVGVWDTVSSIGITRGASFPEAVHGMAHVCHFRHALALDERRVKFWPEHASLEESIRTSSEGDVKEVWFAGCHSDIGGGSIKNLLPIRHPSSNPKKLTWWPHLSAPRDLRDGQRIHESVILLMEEKENSYTPRAKLPSDMSWTRSSLSNVIEDDSFANTAALMSKIEGAVSRPDHAAVQSDIDVLQTIISTDAGKTSLSEFAKALPTLLLAVDYLHSQDKIRSAVFVTLFTALASLPSDPKHKLPFSTFRSVAQTVQGTSKHYVQLIRRHASGLLQDSHESHEGRWIENVAIPTARTRLSACEAKVVIQSDGGERYIDIGPQWCVSFQADGSRFATGDKDGTVKIWDTETGTELRTFEGHSNPICSLAFSPDGRKIAAGSEDGKIRVWDAETGRDLFGAMEGHTLPVCGLAFSPDGTRLASGSFDSTVRLWDEAGKAKVLEGHTNVVTSVAFSKDHIISGSWDDTIRVWDAVSGDSVRVLRGHTYSVHCVAFSPDFKLVASGCNDGTARLWDVSSGEVLAIYDVGEVVDSIAFYFDGKKVVTGSWGGKVHIWNADVLS